MHHYTPLVLKGTIESSHKVRTICRKEEFLTKIFLSVQGVSVTTMPYIDVSIGSIKTGVKLTNQKFGNVPENEYISSVW